MGSIDAEGLIGIQAEKEKKEKNERLRVISKRIDHVDHSFRKQERRLLAQD
jgi:translation initiation factor 3 subunit A